MWGTPTVVYTDVRPTSLAEMKKGTIEQYTLVAQVTAFLFSATYQLLRRRFCSSHSILDTKTGLHGQSSSSD